ncbi:sulfotransferase family protein [Fodinibius halophilus]|uniref:Sulfotransferase n=1 Tax=Fodinibius halophilus TaxID=1736908 RepID=A0A6M1T8M9_9BACT|nr:sulfotransferase [Fodinibius halophilus]NGP86742.1 sulfotransferase [Fodinibius halophilus]
MSSRKHPIQHLTRQIKANDGFSSDNFGRISAFYLKLLIQEPFRLYERLRFSEAINTHSLTKDPIFIIGHWRSGTSFLQYLLSQDPQFGYMNKFQVVFPDTFLGSEHMLKSLVNKIPQTLSLIRDAQNMSINLELDSPSEIEIALTTMISPTSLHWGHIFPQEAWHYFNKYLFFETATDQEIQQWKRDYRHLIQKTSLKNDGRQLLIKSPGNSCRIDKLLELYPDAKFIFIHRNPYDVFYSSKKLWNTLLDNLALQDYSKKEREEAIIAVYEKLMSRYIEQKGMVPTNQLAEIRFEHFITDPIKELSKVYEQLEISGLNTAKPEFEQFLSQKESGKSSDYTYRDNDLAKINRRWKFAFDHWNYSIMHTEQSSKREGLAET